MVTARRAHTIEDDFIEYLQNNKLKRQDEEFEQTIKNCYELLGIPEVYEQHQAEYLKREERKKLWSRCVDVIAFIVIVVIAVYFAFLE